MKKEYECPFCFKIFSDNKKASHICPNCDTNFKTDDIKTPTYESRQVRMCNSPIICDIQYMGKLEY